MDTNWLALGVVGTAVAMAWGYIKSFWQYLSTIVVEQAADLEAANRAPLIRLLLLRRKQEWKIPRVLGTLKDELQQVLDAERAFRKEEDLKAKYFDHMRPVKKV